MDAELPQRDRPPIHARVRGAAAEWTPWSPVLVPVVALVWLVQRHWVNVPFWDSWELATDIRQIHQHGVDVGQLFRQHNEHRIPVPRAAMLALAYATHWDSRAEMTLSMVLALVTLFLLCALLARTLAGLPRAAVIGAATVTAALVFSPMQHQNWLWGFQVAWFMNVLGLVAAVAALTLWPLHRRPLEPVLVAIGGALFSQYSLANGTMVWLCVAPLLVVERYRRLIPVWAVAATVSTIGYFTGYHEPPGRPPVTEIFRHPVEGTRYVCLFLGRTVFENHDVGIAVGAAFLICFAGLCLRLGLRDRHLVPGAAPWICISAYVLLSALSAAVGRAGFGVDQAAMSRYTTIALLFPLAILVIATLLVHDIHGGRVVLSTRRWSATVAAWAVVLAMLAADYPDESRHMAASEATRKAARHCLHTVTSDHARCLTRLYPSPSEVYPRIELLRRLGWLPAPDTNARGAR